MSAPRFLDQGGDWPRGADMARAYIGAFAQGSRVLVSNLRTEVLGLESNGRVMPVTINDTEYGDSYVCLPHTAYALYAKEELRIVDVGPWAPALGLLASSAGALLRSARINRIAHIDNWMLSTNLHGDWAGEDIAGIRDLVTERYPNHIIAIRSLNEWCDSELMSALGADGWKLLPSRQVYVTDDLAAWESHRDTKRDLALLKKTALRVDHLETLRPGDAERIADLYAQLYLDRYSRLNPAFTAAYIEMTHRTGALVYRGLRDSDGQLMAVAGCFIQGGVLTTPIVGYDRSRPAEEGLYRMTSALFALEARDRGLRLHWSAGAASFKLNRGARPVIEYSAFHVDHLSPYRRGVISGVGRVLNRIALPIASRRQL